MKITFFRLILGLAMLLPPPGRGELLFYNGIAKTDLAGDQAEARQTWRVILILDHDAGKMAKFNYVAASGGLKLFTVEGFEAFQTTQVAIGKGKTNSILIEAETGLNTNNQLVAQSAFAKD